VTRQASQAPGTVRLAAFGALCFAAACAVLDAVLAQPADPDQFARGENPLPIQLVRPPAGPLSAMAELGRLVFYDTGLSSSGRLSCGSCHSPFHAYASPNGEAVMQAGPALSREGLRAVPSLMYLERQPSFSIGPDNEEDDNVDIAQLIALSRGTARVPKTAPKAASSAVNIVPQGGLFWDGRADTLQAQAVEPLLDPREMDGGSIDTVAGKLRQTPYAARLAQLFGASVFEDSRLTVAEALFAVARYQIEDASFHPYSSKFDAWLEGKARFTPSELRGYILYNNPAKANCGGCHVDRPSRDGLPPLFTDHQFEALGAPRNPSLAVNRDPAFFDLGICGPSRRDMAGEPQYCGFFKTPTLRNVATRRVFFHNGVFRTLRQVMDFYAFRDIQPQRVYPRAANGAVQIYNDLPPRYRANVDKIDPPFDRKAGEKPAMTAQDEEDIIAFLNTLTDLYQPR
jgi:cytochrome c peroxidase